MMNHFFFLFLQIKIKEDKEIHCSLVLSWFCYDGAPFVGRAHLWLLSLLEDHFSALKESPSLSISITCTSETSFNTKQHVLLKFHLIIYIKSSSKNTDNRFFFYSATSRLTRQHTSGPWAWFFSQDEWG